jgi:hypothetical protein
MRLGGGVRSSHDGQPAPPVRGQAADIHPNRRSPSCRPGLRSALCPDFGRYSADDSAGIAGTFSRGVRWAETAGGACA